MNERPLKLPSHERGAVSVTNFVTRYCCTPSLPPSEPAITGPRPFRESEAGNRAVSAVPEPPEIVIHIGRIDLAAGPEPAPKPRQRSARPPMTDLSDYLRRDGGAR